MNNKKKTEKNAVHATDKVGTTGELIVAAVWGTKMFMVKEKVDICQSRVKKKKAEISGVEGKRVEICRSEVKKKGAVTGLSAEESHLCIMEE